MFGFFKKKQKAADTQSRLGFNLSIEQVNDMFWQECPQASRKKELKAGGYEDYTDETLELYVHFTDMLIEKGIITEEQGNEYTLL